MTTGVAKITKVFLGGALEDISVLAAFAGEEVFAESKDLDFGQPVFNKTLAGMKFLITDRGSIDDVSFYIGGRKEHNDTLTWYGPYSLEEGDTEIWFRIPKYRYFRFKFQDLLPRVQWKLSGVEFYGKVWNNDAKAGPRGRR